MASNTQRLKSAHDWHVYHVYHDADFKRAIRVLAELEKRPNSTPKQIEGYKRSLAKSYLIGVADINLFMLPLYLENQTKTTNMRFDPDAKQFSITFEPTTTRAELLEEWQRFESLRDTLFPTTVVPTKRKPPENPSLLYAVFKCRQHGMTFPAIFKLYSNGKLPGYKGSNNQYGDADSLERYYNRYKKQF